MFLKFYQYKRQMKSYFIYGLIVLIFNCKSNAQPAKNYVSSLLVDQKITPETDKSYVSDKLVVKKVKDNVYEHISYLLTEDFGKVACNGMVVFNDGEAIVFDTPADDSTAALLIDWIGENLRCNIKAVITTHFHADCLGGLEAFHMRQIPSYASNKTINFAKTKNLIVPRHGFDEKLELWVGEKEVIAEFNGEGHTKDNIIGYFPNQKVMFGGCLIKGMNASKGYLGDANVEAWPETVRNIKQKYPEAALIIPGHGASGGQELFDYTINLFKE